MNMKKFVAGIMACCVVGGVIPSAVYRVPCAVTAVAADYTIGTYGQLTYYNYGDYIEISHCAQTATEVEIPVKIEGLPVTRIGDGAFYMCDSLTSVIIPDSVKNIGHSAFVYCKSLTSIMLPDSITNIEEGAFGDCTGLTSITIPKSVENIGYCAFEDCKNLTSLTILNPQCYIHDRADTISNGYSENIGYYFNGTIYGYENSTAQEYAEKYDRKFESLSETPINERMFGDIDGNGKIDASDASLILSYYAYTSTGGTNSFEEYLKSAND